MAVNDKTVFDSGTTVPKSSKTVLESGAALLDGGTTVQEATLFDAEGRSEITVKENAAIQKGDTILDTYRVETDAIEGGMGSVWRVHHTGWNVDLAMKRPQPKCFSTGKSKADFIHECEAWINLGLHPNIVSCCYVREIGGTPTIFSEWMAGGNLESAIESSALYGGTEDERQARLLDIAIQFARGLHYAHEAGLIHQDVKPDNVLLTKEGKAKVADFGLAKARAVLTMLEGSPAMNEAVEGGKTMLSPSGGYTPAYCSMEQMDGRVLTRRTDIYSWAVSVMEMYVGSRPWANGVVAGLNCRSYFENTRIPIPEALKALLAQCLESEQENRPRDFSEIEAQLHAIYEVETGSGYPRPLPKAAADTADSLNNRALSMLDLGKPEEAESCLKQALAKDAANSDAIYNHALFSWMNGRTDDRAAILAVSAIDLPERRETYRARLEQLRGDGGTLPAGEGASRGIFDNGLVVCFNPRDKSAFLLGADMLAGQMRQYKVIHLVNGNFSRVAAMPAEPFWATVSADGMWLCVLMRGEVGLYDIEQGKFSKHVAYTKNDILSACAATDGRGFYQGRTDGLYYYDFAKEGMQRLYASSAYCTRVTQSPNGTLLAWHCRRDRDYDIQVFDIHTKSILMTVESHGRPFLAFSADGRRLYVGEEEGVFSVYNIKDNSVFFRCVLNDGVRFMCAAPGDRYVLTAHVHDCIRVWDMERRICLRSYDGFDGLPFPIYGKDGALRIAALNSRGKYREYPIPQMIGKPAWELSVIADTATQLARGDRFAQAILAAEAAFAAGNYALALERLKEARAVPGRRSEPRCLALSQKLSPYFRRGRLLDVILLRRMPQIAGADLSKDGRFMLDRRTLAVWSVQNGNAVISEQVANRYKAAALIGGDRVAYCYKQGEKEELAVDLYRLPDSERTYSGLVCRGNGVSGVALGIVASPDCENFVISFPGFWRNRYVAVNGSGETLGVYPPPLRWWVVSGMPDVLPDSAAFANATGVWRLAGGKRLLKWSKIPDIQGRVFKLMEFRVTANENEKLAALVSVGHALLRKEKLQHLVDAQNNRLFLFSLKTGKLLRSVRLPKGVYAAHHGGYLTCVQDGGVLLYDIAAFRESDNPEPIRIPVVTEGGSFSTDMLHMFASSSVYFLDWELL